jgi:hypothetical protein
MIVVVGKNPNSSESMLKRFKDLRLLEKILEIRKKGVEMSSMDILFEKSPTIRERVLLMLSGYFIVWRMTLINKSRKGYIDKDTSVLGMDKRITMHSKSL